MRRIVLIALALLVSTLGMTLSASARLGIAPMAAQDDALIQVKHGRGHGHGHMAPVDAVTITVGHRGRGHHKSTGTSAVTPIINTQSSLCSLSSPIARAKS